MRLLKPSQEKWQQKKGLKKFLQLMVSEMRMEPIKVPR